MDANGLRFWMLAEEGDWRTEQGVVYDATRRSLRLRSVSQRLPAAPNPPDPGQTSQRRELVPAARDAYNTWAWWDKGQGKVFAAGALPRPVLLYIPESGERVTDLALSFEGVLYIALDSGAIILQDRRGRWGERRLEPAGFKAWRLAADPRGGMWALDRERGLLARWSGLPRSGRPAGPRTGRPCEIDGVPHLTVLPGEVAAAGETLIGLACSPERRLAVLSAAPDDQALLRLLPVSGPIIGPYPLANAFQAYSLAWVSSNLLALMLAHVASEAPVYNVDLRATDAPLQPVGELYPLRDHSGEPFLHGVDLPPHYPHRPALRLPRQHSLPLDPISRTMLDDHGLAHSHPRRLLDSGNRGATWHRLFLEAHLPPGCGVRAWLAASNEPSAERIAERDWFPHEFGRLPASARLVGPLGGWPRAAWSPYPSELPYHTGLLNCPAEPDRSGLFSVLIQRGDRAVRSLRGRYLFVRLELFGDGRHGPEIAALRAYASRFSYVEKYLPELYRETCFGPEADLALAKDQGSDKSPIRSTAADFLERFVDNFEGQLTPLEDRIAAAYLVTDPRSTPDSALDWLGGWVGMAFDPDLPAARRRKLLQHAPLLYRLHGTLQGLRLAIDIASGGLVSRGQVFVLEDYRLRRTFATILGANLTDEDDPLVAGLWSSGNSFVGDTLFLGDEQRRLQGEFMALYRADVEITPSEQRSITALFDRLAHRVSILVRRETPQDEVRRVRRMVELETPAHIEAKLLFTSNDLLVGLASLIGVDTYLGAKPPIRPVRVGHSFLGLRDQILSPASLDPRYEG